LHSLAPEDEDWSNKPDLETYITKVGDTIRTMAPKLHANPDQGESVIRHKAN
jgi:hypothetical protein